MGDIMFNNQFNPFDELKSSFNIIIMSERQGRKSNTYIYGWNIEKTELKQHLKSLKKKYGCNGSLKIKNYYGEDRECLHLQGEWSLEVKKYLKENNINENEIDVK
jgi:translation initiation factor 1 (eIF-1/SUI1)